MVRRTGVLPALAAGVLLGCADSSGGSPAAPGARSDVPAVSGARDLPGGGVELPLETRPATRPATRPVVKLTGDRTKDKAALVAAATRIATELETLLVEQQALVADGKPETDPAMARIARRLDELNSDKEEVRRLLDALRGGGQ